MIPKVIHYVWVGRKKPDTVKRCIKSWKDTMEGYEIIEHNEDNLYHLIENNSMLKYLYDNKFYGHFSDIIRFMKLYETGGIYLDTDCFFTKPFTYEMLKKKMFVGAQTKRTIGLGVIGVEKKCNPMVGKIINYYDEINAEDIVQQTITDLFIKFLKQTSLRGIKCSFENESKIGQCTIYPREYFYPYFCNPKMPTNFTDKTICVHLYEALWRSGSKRNSIINARKGALQEIETFIGGKL